MKVLETYIMNGPNYWSIKKHQLIVTKLNIEEYEEIPSNKIEGFTEALTQLIPSLYQHRCSENRPGGFLDRVKNGTWMGHIVEHIALEIQTLAGMNCNFGKTRQAESKGIYDVIFEYKVENAGIYALHAAIDIVESLAQHQSYSIEKDIKKLQAISANEGLGPSTSAIINAAKEKGIPYIRLDSDSFVQLGYGSCQKRINGTITENTSNIGVDLASNKEQTKEILKSVNIPVPEGFLVTNEDEFNSAVKELGFPLVVKPLDSNHGKGVRLNINNKEDAFMAFEIAQIYSEKVIIEKYHPGNDYRFLVINNSLCAASLRIPAMVVGDGMSTVEQLVEKENDNPFRGESHEKILTRIKIDHHTPEILRLQNHSLVSVPKAGETVYLKQTANLSTGGTAIDVTDLVHPEIKKMVERAARTIGLDICGIDLIADDISRPVSEIDLSILEVNAAPGFRMHTHPTQGKSRTVGKEVINMLFPDKNGRIPIIAITGTNGKTTTARLINHIVNSAGYISGLTTTDGVYIDNDQIEEGDCTGPISAQKVLKDKKVEFAVLECARGGILRGGLAFDYCDVGIVTNVAEDHIGLKGINSVEEMAHVKSVVPESVANHGYAVLNADNSYSLQMKERIHCNLALFSINTDNEAIQQHIENDGLACVLENNSLLLIKNKQKIFIEKIAHIPCTYQGRANFMIENIQAAVLACYAVQIPMEIIVQSLRTFQLSTENAPGRLNIFQFKSCTLMIDYAHNYHGLKALSSFLKQEYPGYKIGVISIAGDRRDADIVKIGEAAAEIFNKIIIRIDDDTRGREESEIVELITQGIQQIDPEKIIEVIPEEIEALHHAIQTAIPNSLIVHLSDNVSKCIQFARNYQNNTGEWADSLASKQNLQFETYND